MKTLSFIFLWKRHLKVFLFDASSVLNIKKCIFQQRNNIFTRVKPIKKIFFYLLWNQVKTFFQEKTFFSLPRVKPRQSMFFHVWHKKPFSQQEETFFSAEKLIFRRETWETELKPRNSETKRKYVCPRVQGFFIHFLFRRKTVFRSLFFQVYLKKNSQKKNVFFSFYSGSVCETELKLLFHVWHQEKWWFSIKNIFDFFSGEKNL